MLEKLQQRWGLKSITQVVLVLIAFAATGTTVMLLKRPIVGLFTENGEQPLLFTILYYLLILPVYNVILLAYGLLFGQFDF
ncbi:MAG: prolipoprotein diacylglyceryl transferase, partial [Cyclobacteriaceae bacterium]